MSEGVAKTKIKLSDGTEKIIDYIDLFDEGTYGAEMLYLAGRFPTLSEVKAQIQKFFAEASKDIYDNNRLNIPNKRFILNHNSFSHLKCPKRAAYRVQFLLRIHYYGDFGYLHVGIPWGEDEDPGSPAELAPPDTSKFTILKKCWLSDEEAEKILKEIKP